MTTAEAVRPGEAVERLHGDCWREVEDERVELIAQRCTQCAAGYLPKALACVRCGGRAFTPQVLSARGTLYSYSIVHGSGGVWPDLYAVGYVDFPEGVRVFGQLRDTAESVLRCGALVGVEPATLYRRKDGTDVRCFRFFVDEVKA